MNLKEHLKHGLVHSGYFTDKYLAELETPEDWMLQTSEDSNHAMWIAGHLGFVHNYFISQLDPSKTDPKEGYSELFGKGSTPTTDASKYPPAAEVMDYLKNRRQELMGVVDAMSDEDFDQPAPEKTPGFMKNMAGVFQGATWHETLHCGQLSAIIRKLGKKPLSDRAAPAKA